MTVPSDSTQTSAMQSAPPTGFASIVSISFTSPAGEIGRTFASN